MKKVLFAFSMALLLQPALTKAQDGNNICVWNAINNYNQGGGTGELERATKCADEAAVNEATSGKWKTWFYRGQLYATIFLDTTISKKYPNAPFEATAAFKKLYEINDPKFKEWEEVYNLITPLSVNMFNMGADQYNDKNYAMGYKTFYAIKDLNTIMEGKSQKMRFSIAQVMKFAAICAESSGNNDAAATAYKEWLALAPEASAYYRLGDLYKRTGKKEEAKKLADEGIAKFPKDANLLVLKINFFLEDSNYTAALNYVNNLLEVEPKNDGALFIKGMAFDKMGKEDSVVYYYLKAAEVNPKNDNAWNNLAAVYVNRANEIYKDMQKLGNTAADNKKYEEMKAKRKDLYMQAKPYVQKAHDLRPDDTQIARTLKQIESYTNE